MNLKLMCLVVSLVLPLSLIEDIEAKNKCCISIPCRPANPARDPFNGTIPAANIEVRIEGKKQKNPTIVFINGDFENISEWSCTQEALKDKYRTVAFDLRGFGRSTKTPAPFPPVVPPPAHEINYTIQVFADDLHAVLTSLGITDNLVLVGRSFGTNVAVNYATTYSGVKQLVLVSGAPLFFVDCQQSPLPPCMTTTSKAPVPNCSTCKASCCKLYPPIHPTKNPICCIYPSPLAYLEFELAQVTACLEKCKTTNCEVNCVLENAIKPYFFNEPCTSPSFLKLQRNFSKNVLAQITNPALVTILSNLAAVGLGQDQRDLLSRIRVPTLICYGSIDASIDPRNSLYMHQHLKNSILAEFVGKGHELNLTDVKNFNDLLCGFVAGKKYPSTLKIGKAKSCDPCASSYTSINLTECKP